MHALIRVDAARLSAPARQRTVIDPARLTPSARRQLTDALYACHRRIFAGVDREAFARYVVESPAAWTRIFVQTDGAGEIRGYAAFHVYDVEHDGRSMAVVRMEAGFEPAWRRGTVYGRFATACFARARLYAGRRPLYFVCSPVHPSSFVALSRVAPQRWIVPEAGPATRRFMLALARTLGMRSIGEGIYAVGWITRHGPAPRRISPEAATYIAANPGYGEGHGLLTVVPVTAGGILRGLGRLLARRLRRRPSAR